ncbi:MAG: hypothetical protein AXA67_04255 [Methylothermaceae bacteria B42]|nr:MAG: hypothetical protein AXA67_04255 [Methylothermaceae bacteria B42]HHJ38656.1 DUF4962 domain-containing protein [Methylothermaceae bacterium]
MEHRRHFAGCGLLVALYVALVVYGTLFPLEHLPWDTPVDRGQLFDWEQADRALSKADIIINWLVYIPLGWLLFGCLSSRLKPVLAFMVTVFFGASLSIGLEYIQLYLPARVTSFSDILLNTLGTATGALLAVVIRTLPVGRWLIAKRQQYFLAGALADLGLLIFGFWMLSELMPLVPSLDLGNLKDGVKPVWRALHNPKVLDGYKVAAYVFNLTVLGLLLSRIVKPDVSFFRLFVVLVAAVLLAKIVVVERQLSGESLVGLGLASVLLLLIRPLSRSRGGCFLAIAMLAAAEVIHGLFEGKDDSLPVLHAFNWIPFAGQQNGISGLIDLLLSVWPAMAMAFFLLSSTQERKHGFFIVIGAIALFALEFFIEWQQQFVPGRYPDITDVFMAVGAWWFAWFWVKRRPEVAYQQPANSTAVSVPSQIWLWIALAGGSMAGTVFLLSQKATDSPSYESAKYPDPKQLTLPPLPGFDYIHPRLPAPSPAEWIALQRHDPHYLQSLKKKAKHGSGDFNAIAMMGLIEPSNIDFEVLTQRLTAMKYSWRGHIQAMPMAMLYDWLYLRFSPIQRAKLQEKLAEGCRYLIQRIRDNALSPYNVYLYNSTFQALMAVSLVLYGDHPEGKQCLAFSYDFWKNRVLPVWRQVMGNNGGWHEGGEYVGIGIGKAIYSVPAMWRSATGEDLLRANRGIRGFLDFLIYRLRPDHTHMRWGDARFFDRWVPERYALAIEYRHKAAYSFFGCKPFFHSSAWPWGPLPDESLCDPDAIHRLPLQKHFDGIGMVIARSDWTDDATYVTFKAGDNFWSHSHLDQGAFTLYKGGPLAIDSGLYGPGYGSDHHMNYTYQTIAHNVITVTDPEDTAPMPEKNKKPPRPIANDGGQRRVGSGWGKRAPLDVIDWLNQRQTYHTGHIARYYAGNDLVVAVAELTPAYTNANCGRGDFYNRTCRVKRYWRTFLYDRRADVVVIYDDITSTNASFIKRSLVHTIQMPLLTASGFTVDVMANPKQFRRGGQMAVEVLFPKKARLEPIGGEGYEFWVDGINYDENGAVWETVRKSPKNPPEPGRWRVEITPPQPQERDKFLMVLKPSLRGEENQTQVLPLQAGETIGCRIIGDDRSLSLIFPDRADGVKVKFNNGMEIDLTVPRQ